MKHLKNNNFKRLKKLNNVKKKTKKQDFKLKHTM